MKLNLETIHFWFIGDSGETELMILSQDEGDEGQFTAEFSNVMGKMVHKTDTKVVIHVEGTPNLEHYSEAENLLEEDDDEDDEY